MATGTSPAAVAGVHHFVAYGDCCSGVPGAAQAAAFARVNAVLQEQRPAPEFIVFLGDHIRGGAEEPALLRAQWDHWLNHEMDWAARLAIPVYHVTSNHDTADARAERVWREVFPAIPHNGPPGQEGLAYWVRRGDLLLVAVNTNFSRLGGAGHVEHRWLEAVLARHRDARYRVVLGHHPVHAVNGYAEAPLWRIEPAEGAALWGVLARHRVAAYLCSHVIAFDVQEHAGVIQLCSGGAGTRYGPGGFMGDGEYHHFVRLTLDACGLEWQSVDSDGVVRENGRKALP